MTGRRLSTRFDPSNERPIYVEVIELLAEISQTDPTDIPPLSETIDPDALDALYSGNPDSAYPEISFSHFGYQIQIDRNGRILVEEPVPWQN